MILCEEVEKYYFHNTCKKLRMRREGDVMLEVGEEGDIILRETRAGAAL